LSTEGPSLQDSYFSNLNPRDRGLLTSSDAPRHFRTGHQHGHGRRSTLRPSARPSRALRVAARWPTATLDGCRSGPPLLRYGRAPSERHPRPRGPGLRPQPEGSTRAGRGTVVAATSGRARRAARTVRAALIPAATPRPAVADLDQPTGIDPHPLDPQRRREPLLCPVHDGLFTMRRGPSASSTCDGRSSAPTSGRNSSGSHPKTCRNSRRCT